MLAFFTLCRHGFHRKQKNRTADIGKIEWFIGWNIWARISAYSPTSRHQFQRLGVPGLLLRLTECFPESKLRFQPDAQFPATGLYIGPDGC